MSFRWSEETTLKFVEKYLEHECLWNIKSTHYKNKIMKESAYLDLENSMNLSGFGVKEIKMKIKNIRSTYSQELKKIKKVTLTSVVSAYHLPIYVKKVHFCA
nr:unnamed protein product [Callosobruchus analis]